MLGEWREQSAALQHISVSTRLRLRGSGGSRTNECMWIFDNQTVTKSFQVMLHPTTRSTASVDIPQWWLAVSGCPLHLRTDISSLRFPFFPTILRAPDGQCTCSCAPVKSSSTVGTSRDASLLSPRLCRTVVGARKRHSLTRTHSGRIARNESLGMRGEGQGSRRFCLNDFKFSFCLLPLSVRCGLRPALVLSRT